MPTFFWLFWGCLIESINYSLVWKTAYIRARSRKISYEVIGMVWVSLSRRIRCILALENDISAVKGVPNVRTHFAGK